MLAIASTDKLPIGGHIMSSDPQAPPTADAAGAPTADPSSRKPRLLRFGVFELEPEAERLTRGGARVKLQAQPLSLLTLLAERSGELVSREEIQEHLWGKDVHVDFDQGINVCVRQVRQALGDDASSPRFVETVPRKGYRFLAPVERVERRGSAGAARGRAGTEGGKGGAGACRREATGDAAGPAPADLLRHRRRSPGRRGVPWGWIAALAPVLILGAVLLTAYLVLAQRGPEAPAETEAAASSRRPLVLVLPFGSPGEDGDSAWLADGLTTELITELQRTYRGRLRVMGQTTTLALRGGTPALRGGEPAGGSRSALELAREAREWGVDHLVTGRVERRGPEVRVQASLSSLVPSDDAGARAPESRDWAAVFEESGEDLARLRRDLARRIGRAVAGNLGALPPVGEGAPDLEVPDLPPGVAERRATAGPEAWEAYLRGRFHLAQADGNPEDLLEARQAFRRALELDPGFALAHAGLAAALRSLPPGSTSRGPGWEAEIEDALESALSLDPALPEAYLHRGYLRFYQRWDVDGAGEDWRHALDLAPSYTDARHALAAWYSVRGEHEEAMETVEEAYRLDPLAPGVVNDRGWYAYFGRRPERAAERCRETLTIDPDHPWVPQCLLLAGLAAGEPETALDGARRVLRMVRGELQGAGGEPAPATVETGAEPDPEGELERTLREILAALEQLRSRGRPVSPSAFALYHMALGEEAPALDELEAAVRQRSGWILPFLGVHPLFDPLRDEPRFQRLEERVLGPEAGRGEPRL